MPEVHEVSGRVDRLEEMMMQVAYEHTKTEMALRDLKHEMSNFKREMQDFKDEMRGFKEEMRDFKDEMRGFKDEMSASKKENDRRWGDLANKMGTLVEDIVAPSLPRIVRQDFGCSEIDDIMLRRRVRNKSNPAQVREFDAIVVAGDMVFINETKSNPNSEKVYDFIQVLHTVHEFLPEYQNKRIIPLFSSLYIPEDILNLLTKNKIFALALGEDTMQILNLEQIVF
ncbi:MAG: hypothetical protein ACLFPB_05825 [Desulfovermiculus sp.]